MDVAVIDKDVAEFKPEPIAIPNQDYQRAIEQAYAAIRSSDGCVPGSFFPLTHQFANGLYIRTIFVPKGYMVLTYVHKQSHPAFQLKGDTTVIEPTGNTRIKGQHQFITAAGTQRLCYCHEDTVWTTVHLNLKNETDIDKIEKEIYASHYSELFIETKKGELSFMEENTEVKQ